VSSCEGESACLGVCIRVSVLVSVCVCVPVCVTFYNTIRGVIICADTYLTVAFLWA
jgi:hypothetical protein